LAATRRARLLAYTAARTAWTADAIGLAVHTARGFAFFVTARLTHHATGRLIIAAALRLSGNAARRLTVRRAFRFAVNAALRLTLAVALWLPLPAALLANLTTAWRITGRLRGGSAFISGRARRLSA